jgi:hypothetical protein
MLLIVVCNASPDKKESPSAGADPVVGTGTGAGGIGATAETDEADSGAGLGGSAVVFAGVLDDGAGTGVGLGFQLETLSWNEERRGK